MPKLMPMLILALSTMLMLTTTPLTSAADEDERCAELGNHPAVVRRQNKAWKTPLPADGEATLRVWDTTCRDWQKRHHRWEPDGEEKANAWSAAAWERSERRYRNRIDCTSTWDHYPYSSRLITICTTH